MADLERVFAENPGKVACVIMTPVGHPMALPIIAPPPGYLETVKEIAHQNGAVLIFDESARAFVWPWAAPSSGTASRPT